MEGEKKEEDDRAEIRTKSLTMSTARTATSTSSHVTLARRFAPSQGTDEDREEAETWNTFGHDPLLAHSVLPGSGTTPLDLEGRE